MSRYLIVAYQTAGGAALRAAIEELARNDRSAEFVLLVPATHAEHLVVWTEGESRAVAEERAEKAAGRLREVGVSLIETIIGPADPLVAVANELSRGDGYEAIVVSTFPPGISRWLRRDLPTQLEKETGLRIIHVVVAPEDGSGS